MLMLLIIMNDSVYACGLHLTTVACVTRLTCGIGIIVTVAAVMATATADAVA